MSKTFYCVKCEEEVECELEEYAISHSTATGKGYFCPLCGEAINDTPDPDAEYEKIRDDKMFEEERIVRGDIEW